MLREFSAYGCEQKPGRVIGYNPFSKKCIDITDYEGPGEPIQVKKSDKKDNEDKTIAQATLGDIPDIILNAFTKAYSKEEMEKCIKDHPLLTGFGFLYSNEFAKLGSTVGKVGAQKLVSLTTNNVSTEMRNALEAETKALLDAEEAKLGRVRSALRSGARNLKVWGSGFLKWKTRLFLALPFMVYGTTKAMQELEIFEDPIITRGLEYVNDFAEDTVGGIKLNGLSCMLAAVFLTRSMLYASKVSVKAIPAAIKKTFKIPSAISDAVNTGLIRGSINKAINKAGSTPQLNLFSILKKGKRQLVNGDVVVDDGILKYTGKDITYKISDMQDQVLKKELLSLSTDGKTVTLSADTFNKELAQVSKKLEEVVEEGVTESAAKFKDSNFLKTIRGLQQATNQSTRKEGVKYASKAINNLVSASEVAVNNFVKEVDKLDELFEPLAAGFKQNSSVLNKAKTDILNGKSIDDAIEGTGLKSDKLKKPLREYLNQFNNVVILEKGLAKEFARLKVIYRDQSGFFDAFPTLVKSRAHNRVAKMKNSLRKYKHAEVALSALFTGGKLVLVSPAAAIAGSYTIEVADHTTFDQIAVNMFKEIKIANFLKDGNAVQMPEVDPKKLFNEFNKRVQAESAISFLSDETKSKTQSFNNTLNNENSENYKILNRILNEGRRTTTIRKEAIQVAFVEFIDAVFDMDIAETGKPTAQTTQVTPATPLPATTQTQGQQQPETLAPSVPDTTMVPAGAPQQYTQKNSKRESVYVIGDSTAVGILSAVGNLTKGQTYNDKVGVWDDGTKNPDKKPKQYNWKKLRWNNAVKLAKENSAPGWNPVQYTSYSGHDAYGGAHTTTIRSKVLKRLEQEPNYKPQMAIIHMGYNDDKSRSGKTRQNFKDIIDALKERGVKDIRVIIPNTEEEDFKPTKISKSSFLAYFNNAKRTRDAIRDLDADPSVTFIQNPSGGSARLKSDGIHFTNPGSKKLFDDAVAGLKFTPMKPSTQTQVKPEPANIPAAPGVREDVKLDKRLEDAGGAPATAKTKEAIQKMFEKMGMDEERYANFVSAISEKETGGKNDKEAYEKNKNKALTTGRGFIGKFQIGHNENYRNETARLRKKYGLQNLIPEGSETFLDGPPKNKVKKNRMSRKEYINFVLSPKGYQAQELIFLHFAERNYSGWIGRDAINNANAFEGKERLGLAALAHNTGGPSVQKWNRHRENYRKTKNPKYLKMMWAIQDGNGTPGENFYRDSVKRAYGHNIPRLPMGNKSLRARYSVSEKETRSGRKYKVIDGAGGEQYWAELYPNKKITDYYDENGVPKAAPRSVAKTVKETLIMTKNTLKDFVSEVIKENSGQGYAKYPYNPSATDESEPTEDYMEEWKALSVELIRDESRNTAIEIAKLLVKDLELFEDVLDLAGQNQSIGTEILTKLKQNREKS